MRTKIENRKRVTGHAIDAHIAHIETELRAALLSGNNKRVKILDKVLTRAIARLH